MTDAGRARPDGQSADDHRADAPSTDGPRVPPKIPRPGPPPTATSAAVAALCDRLADASAPTQRRRIAEQFLGSTSRWPLVEPCDDPTEAIFTFAWDDPDAREVLIFVNRITDERRLDESLMESLGDCGLWVKSYRLSRTWRASYGFVPARDRAAHWRAAGDQVQVRAALDHAVKDPRNDRVQRNRRGIELSIAEGDRAPAQPWLAQRHDVPRGTVESVILPGGGRGWWYQSAPGPDHAAAGDGTTDSEADAAGAGVPLLIVTDGLTWLQSQHLPTILDNMVADRAIPPLRAVLVDSGTRHQRWQALGDPEHAADYIAADIVPWARSRDSRIGARPSDVVVAGQSLGGLVALLSAARHPNLVGGVIAQSASLWLRDLRDGSTRPANARANQRIYLEVGIREWVLLPIQRQIADWLETAGPNVAYREFDGGHDDACWRGGISDGLSYVLAADTR